MDRTAILIARLKAVGVKIERDDSYFLERFESEQDSLELETLYEQMARAAQEDTRSVEEAYAEFDRAIPSA